MPNGTYGGVRGGLNSPYSIVPLIQPVKKSSHFINSGLTFYLQADPKVLVL